MGARPYLPILGRFLQVDPVEGGTDNNYAYANDPVNEFDLDGRAIETIADMASIAYDAQEFYRNPSWGNAGMIAWSVAATLVPFVPGSYTGREVGAGVKAFSRGKMLIQPRSLFRLFLAGILVQKKIFRGLSSSE